MKNRTTYNWRGVVQFFGGLLLVPMIALTPACEEVNDGNGAFDDFIEVMDADGNVVSDLSFPEVGGAVTLDMTSKGKGWLVVRESASPGGDWVSVTPKVAKAGKTTATVTVQANTTSPTERTAAYLFMCGKLQHRLTLSQPAAPVVTTGEASEVEFDRALLSGSWDYQGEETIRAAEYGFKYRIYGQTEWTLLAATLTDSPAQTAQSGEAEDRAEYFEARVQELERGANYEYRAFVISPERGEIEGEINVLKLEAAPASLSVAALRSQYGGENFSLANPSLLTCVVVSDADGGNVPEDCFFAVDANDATQAGSGILITQPSGADAPKAGDKVEILVREAVVGVFNRYPAVLAVEYPERITKVGTAAVVPVVVSDPALLPEYESMLVSVDRTQVQTLFLDAPNWSSNASMLMEVEGNSTAYSISVLKSAVFAAEAVKRGSGRLVGVVASQTRETKYLVMPRTAADIALSDDEATRFASTLELQFTAITLDGSLYEGMASDARLVVAYQNAAGETIRGSDIDFSISGVSGLEAVPAASYELSYGTGYLEIPLVGTPGAAGTALVTLTRIGNYTLPAQPSVGVEVKTPVSEEFMIGWAAPSGTNPSKAGQTAGPETHVLAVTQPSEGVRATPLAGNTQWSVGGPNYNNTLGGLINPQNTQALPETYMQFTLTADVPAMSLSELRCELRIGAAKGQTAQPTTIWIMYRIGDGPIGTIREFVEESGAANPVKGSDEAIDLSQIPELQGVPQGTEVKFMIVPCCPTNTEKIKETMVIKAAPSIKGTCLK